MDVKIIKLCCGGKGCPTIKSAENNQVVITDDYGNEIKIKKEEAELIHEALKQL